MLMEVSPVVFRATAETFQRTKQAANETTESQELSSAKSALKVFAKAGNYRNFVACIQDADALTKIIKKFTEWQKKSPSDMDIKDEDTEVFEKTLQRMAKAFLDSTHSPAVLAARSAKEEFKRATFEALRSGRKVETLEGELVGLAPLTVKKIRYWSNKG